jgi:hypothetical protein
MSWVDRIQEGELIFCDGVSPKKVKQFKTRFLCQVLQITVEDDGQKRFNLHFFARPDVQQDWVSQVSSLEPFPYDKNIAESNGILNLQTKLDLPSSKLVISALTSCNLLKEMDFSGNRLENETGIAILKHMQQPGVLVERLSLGGNNLDHECANDILLMLQKNRNLTHLILSSNPLKNESVDLLAEGIRCNSTLVSLFLETIDISEDRALQLKDALEQNMSLQEYSMRNNTKIPDESSKMITVEVKKLIARNISLRSYYMKETILACILRQKCDIRWDKNCMGMISEMANMLPPEVPTKTGDAQPSEPSPAGINPFLLTRMTLA